MRTIKGGLLIAIEGIDGAGKSTLARGLARVLSDIGIDPILTKEPTTGPYGAALRESAIAGRRSAADELALFVADRREHVAKLLAPALAEGRVVILDRYYFSNAAYQGAAGLDADKIIEANEAFAPRPDLLILLDLPPEIGLARIAARGDKANEFETIDNLKSCRAIFRSAPKAIVIDATKSADAVLAEARDHVIAAVAKVAHERFGFGVEAAQSIKDLVGPLLQERYSALV
ncbi:dTMP kinase [Tahibacter caeni]|uniref:dTMP kinase n=1 Tax=Tahibacter caeni TaxID=1453545 RepID=UPI0031BA53E2